MVDWIDGVCAGTQYQHFSFSSDGVNLRVQLRPDLTIPPSEKRQIFHIFHPISRAAHAEGAAPRCSLESWGFLDFWGFLDSWDFLDSSWSFLGCTADQSVVFWESFWDFWDTGNLCWSMLTGCVGRGGRG